MRSFKIGASITVLLVFGLGRTGILSASSQANLQSQTPSSQTYSQTPGPDPVAKGEYKPGEVLVKFETGVASTAVQQRLERTDATRVRYLYGSDVQIWEVPIGQEMATVEQLKADPSVAFAQPNYLYRVLTVPDDPGYGHQWAHPLLGSPGAWDITTGSAAVTIAIIDTGIDGTHPDLADKIVPGFDFVARDGDPQDGHGHGTHVAGIAAATSNNSAGVAGLDWQARIMAVRVLDEYGVGWDSDIAEGIRWAYQNGAKVLNLSLGGPGYSQAMQDAINAAHDAGSLVVAAMGNCRAYDPYACPTPNPSTYPAAYENVFAVAATNRADAFAYYSQYGSHCDIAAPGGEMSYLHDPDGIYSTMPTYPVYLTTQFPNFSTSYDYLQGTSQATPHVAALAALVWSVNTSLTPEEVQDIIQTTAVDLGKPGWDLDYGYGRINPRAALEVVAVPGAVTDLRVTRTVTDTNTVTATLRWSPPLFAGKLNLRYSRAALNQDNWAVAEVLGSALPGSTDTFVATVPYSGTVYFALRSQAANGTWSAPSNNAFWPARDLFLPLATRLWNDTPHEPKVGTPQTYQPPDGAWLPERASER